MSSFTIKTKDVGFCLPPFLDVTELDNYKTRRRLLALGNEARTDGDPPPSKYRISGK